MPTSTRSPKVRRSWILGPGPILLLGATALMSFDPRSAEACTGNVVIDVLMQGGRADFGNDPHLLGAPTNPGKLCWTAGGVAIDGFVYYDDLFAAGCARATVSFQRSNGTYLPNTERMVCSSGGLRKLAVSTSVSDPAVARVTVVLAVSATANGPRTIVASQNFYRP